MLSGGNSREFNPLLDDLSFCGSHFCISPVLSGFQPQTSHKCPYSLPLHIRDSIHTHQLISLQQSWLSAGNHLSRLGKRLNCHEWGSNKVRGRFSQPVVHRTKSVHPVLTKVFSKLSPETAMLYAPFKCTNPPPPVLPFLLKQNLSLQRTLPEVTS